MKKCSSYMALLSVVVGCSLTVIADPRESTGNQKLDNKLSKLSWITGTWVANVDGDHLEKIWSEPVGDTMMGVFRGVKGGKAWINEIVTITADSEESVFRLRHFDRKMTAWEDKEKPFYYPLEQVGRNEIMFENPQLDDPRSITYRRVDDSLCVILDGYKDGQMSGSTEFVFQRK